ncbi:MAG: lipoyl(octanoyl) transferase LipB [Phycisphaeraceae bacterium]|nr:lipoyl(octanoyl) transferase LipB [Phycisphaeraceae bacterium]
MGRIAYEPAYELQCAAHARVLASRQDGSSGVGELLLVEHEPVITISNRASAAANLIASQERLARSGVSVARTDRGGDITYHGPGQLVAYPILDLNSLNLGLHDYMRLLEETVISVCAKFGVETIRDPGATGVWTARKGSPQAKIAAMGVRVRKWISMHGLAINVTTDLDHFNLIVPCGLVGRQVTSLSRELGPRCPAMPAVKAALLDELAGALDRQRDRAESARAAAAE